MIQYINDNISGSTSNISYLVTHSGHVAETGKSNEQFLTKRSHHGAQAELELHSDGGRTVQLL